jgi:nicotinamidase-related amidase
MNLTMDVRWMREVCDPGVPSTESNLKHGEARWTIPSEQTAIVLVDCWADYDALKSVFERHARIAREKILPAVRACRAAGVTVVHCPSESWAANYPQNKVYAGDGDLFPEKPTPPPWPPLGFVNREGDYARFRAPWLSDEPEYKAWQRRCPPSARRVLDFLGPEPGDFMPGTAEQLHRLCRDRKILHLIYAGFAANICLQFRPYGTRAMRNRGYNIILLRDATSAIETPETAEGRWLTQASILDIEMKVGVSTTVDDLVKACKAV